MALKYLYVPSGYKAGTAYGVLPNDSTADFDEFVRDTSATRTNKDGLLESMGNNVPRLDYSDGGCPSLLLEAERTNLAKYSEQITSWNKNPNDGTVTVRANEQVSPDGEDTADVVSVLTQYDGVYTQSITSVTNTKYSCSAYVKHVSGSSKIRVGITSGFISGTGSKYVSFDLSNGSTILNGLDGEADFKSVYVGNGWYRLIIENCTGYGSSSNFVVYSYENGFTEFAVWGGQIEVGSYASSYIPNLSNSQTTRNGDKGNLAGNFDALDNDSGVFEARFKAFDTDNSSRRITLGATDSNRVVLGYGYDNGTVKPYLLIVGSANDDIYISMPSSFNIFDYNTYQLKFESGNNELKINGELVDTDTTFNTLNFTFSASLTNISLNYYNNSSNRIFQGGLKHIKVYDSITDF